jgi:hypothetical protein
MRHCMELKNYQEDVVLGLIDILLEDEPEYSSDREFKYDVAAFTLNRIPPKYFMSERGFTRFADLYLSDDDNADSFLNLVELSVIVNRAIDTIKLRRSGRSNDPADRSPETDPPSVDYIHNFPHIIGRALDSTTGTPVAQATVTLVSGETPVATTGSGWPNPYRTTQQGKGYFSFWPRYLTHPQASVAHTLGIRIEHSDYLPFSFDISLETRGEFERRNIVANGSIMSLETCLLEPKG